MSRPKGSPVLVVGIDSAEATLVRSMIEADEMPVLQSLLSAGKWISLNSPSAIGTSSVWPTFMTSEDPEVHGIYSEWCWEPQRMGLSSLTGRQLVPFWKSYAEDGNSLGILGVPFMPFVPISNGFEISDAEPYLSPENHTEVVTAEVARQALSHGHILVAAPDDNQNLQKLAADSLQGVELRGNLAESLLKQMRPDLSIIVFTEAHESAHCLWQTIEPQHALFNGGHYENLKQIRPTVKDIYQAIDGQIGKLIQAAGEDATVLVLSLHGMSPALGVPAFLAPLMCAAGFARIACVKDQSWVARATRLVAAAKRRTPAALKEAYYRTMPRSTVLKWASPTLLPQYDWTQTRAFPLVIEQHGSIRINLIGREAQGIVSVEEYAEACRQIGQWVSKLRTDDGKPLAKRVIRTAENGAQALERRIPDLVIHWEDVAFRSPLRIKGSPIEFHRAGKRYLSQHTSEGFCILKRRNNGGVGEVMRTKDLGQLIIRLAQH
jgi:predicted AlkP superfamily phosphohydrolase/phosphomutase